MEQTAWVSGGIWLLLINIIFIRFPKQKKNGFFPAINRITCQGNPKTATYEDVLCIFVIFILFVLFVLFVILVNISIITQTQFIFLCCKMYIIIIIGFVEFHFEYAILVCFLKFSSIQLLWLVSWGGWLWGFIYVKWSVQKRRC